MRLPLDQDLNISPIGDI